MARSTTRTRVFAATLGLVGEQGLASTTMEAIASRAGVGKQTLYRSWPSKAAILVEALLERSLVNGGVDIPRSGELASDLQRLVTGTVAELTDPTMERLLRAITAEVQSDSRLAADVVTGLLQPQTDAVAARLRESGVVEADAGAELLFGAVFHRWLLRTGDFSQDWIAGHVRRTLRALT